MRISRFAVHRPIFTIMVVLIVMILGAISLLRLPIDLMPDITYPTLSVSCTYQNAGPEEIEELIVRPIEQAISAVPGVEEMSSTAVEGEGTVRVRFTWGTDLDAAANDIRDRIDRIIDHLPEDAVRPSLRKFDLASFSILSLGASSNLDPIQTRQIIDEQIQYRLERVPGVAAVTVRGGLDREIHVALDPAKINALAIPLESIIARVREGNVNVPAGTIEKGNMEITIRTPGEYTDLKQIQDTVVAIRQGVPVQLREIALVEDSWQKITRIVRVNGKPGIWLSVYKQSGKNTVDVARAALAELERINHDIPQIKIIPIIDSSDYIVRSISNVGSSAIYGGLLAVLVLLLFLRNFRSTIVVATAIPVSIIATFALLYFSHFTLNIMTLGGMALGIGMCVDSSIVVLENIYRMQEGGETPLEAAVDGTEEVAAAIVAGALTTCVVFLPMIFIRGMSGVMFKQLAYVVSFANLCGLFVALTVIPMLCSRLIRLAKPAKAIGEKPGCTFHGSAFQMSARFFMSVENGYKRLLHVALANRALVVAAAVLLLGVSLLLVPYIGTELMPATDEGVVRAEVEMAVGTRLSLLDEKFKVIEKIVNDSVPEIKCTVVNVGGSRWYGSTGHTGDVRISLVPQSQRTRSSEQVAADLRKKLSNIPGTVIRTRADQGLIVFRFTTQGADKVQVEVRGHDLQMADVLAAQVKEIVESVEGITDARMSREAGTPEELILIDRQKAADMNLTVSKIANVLQTILSGTRAGYYRQAGDEFAILVKLRDAEQMDLRDILDLTITNSDGEPVVLRNVVTVGPRKGPSVIERIDQERVVNISAEVSGRDMGSVLAELSERFQKIPIPSDFAIGFGGDYEEQQKSFRDLLLSFILALVLVYMVMACQYESLRDPFVVMFSVPLAAIGVILVLYLTRTTFNIQSFIGCIMLEGVVVNNAIIIVDYTNLLRRRDGMPLREAIEEAGRRRLRPILMTTLATVIGLIPLALGLGEGGEAQAPLARTVIGGLFSSTLISLVFVPVVYSLFEGLRSATLPTNHTRVENVS